MPTIGRLKKALTITCRACGHGAAWSFSILASNSDAASRHSSKAGASDAIRSLVVTYP